ncbi:MAG: hypothetical protein JRN64_04590 [Nitrososphaerota archaeon]|nr:hypothetical protein [Nitrososphaerota archaeon]
MRPKTTTASFRLDESALGVLQEDARKQNISVNAMINSWSSPMPTTTVR